MARKKIAFLTAVPEQIFQRRLMKGIFRQCNKYGYDVVVVSQFAMPCIIYNEELEGEMSIFKMMNFEKFDGIIIDTLTITLARAVKVKDVILNKLKDVSAPVVCISKPLGDYPAVNVDTGNAIEEITEHLITKHGCKEIYMVTGREEDSIAIERADGFKRAMNKHGLNCEDSITYAEFWYNGADGLANDIKEGKVKKPDAVVCACDHIAIGLVKKLQSYGYRVPEDIKVTGYDGLSEGAVFRPSITSYIPDDEYLGALAVREIHNKISEKKDEELLEKESGFIASSSCGCPVNHEYVFKKFDDLLTDRSIIDAVNHPVDLMTFNGAYVLESLTGTESPEECIELLTHYTYLFEPYEEFRLCLRKDWLKADPDEDRLPKEVMTVLCSISEKRPLEERNEKAFNGLYEEDAYDIEEIHPHLFEEREKPAAFFIFPVHYLQTVLGYGILECDITKEPRPDIVVNSWFRSLNTALNVTRMQYRLRSFSEFDVMTGLLNRRGMENRLKKALDKSTEEDDFFAASIDMDRLKYINDNYGHSEGDRCIRDIATCLSSIALKNELCVRTGGDEFMLIGVGVYDKETVSTRIDALRNEIYKASLHYGKEHSFSASIGYSMSKVKNCDVAKVINEADEEMYKEKSIHHKLDKNLYDNK